MNTNTFNALTLDPALMSSIERIGFSTPTEIQEKTIPALLSGQDVIGQSKTGSGKTAAYMLPIMNSLMNSDKLALILVPTRELAIQVAEFAFDLTSKQVRAKIAVVIGGGSMRNQQYLLAQKPNIIVATPGRLFDHLSRGNVKLDRLTVLTLDEADRMLDMGFYPQIKKIMISVPKIRQTILFSATFSPEVSKLAKEMMNKPKEVSVGDKNSAPVSIDQQVIEVDMLKKKEILLDQLNLRKGSKLIFARTKSRTARLAEYLLDYGHKVTQIHGDRSMNQRIRAIDEFKSGRVDILVATDIAARGLDIAQVGHVINFDIPQHAEDYVHRIGRTGRAGHLGNALSLVSPEERKYWKLIAKFTGKTLSDPNAPLTKFR